MKEPTSGKSLASTVLTAKALDLSPQLWKKEPKVKVKRVDSLFLISYSDAASSRLPIVLPTLQEFHVSLYIDIPTIDYYNDQLTHNRLSKINKKFKIHKLREQILASVTNFEDSAWDSILKQGSPKWPIKITFSVSSSGALRYVETIKFLVESCWHRILEHTGDSNSVHAVFKIQVSPTSLIWFKTFLDKDLLDRAVVQFEVIGNYNMITSSTTPFKEYYSMLSDKFTTKASVDSPGGNPPADVKTLDSIIVVTNSTGVKALLTILSDRPLTSYLSKDSLEALHSNALQKKPSKAEVVEQTDSDDDDTPLKRDSSSLLNFQESLITSNKDKSVKVRSIPYSRSSSRTGRSSTPNTFQVGTDNFSTDEDTKGSDLQQFENEEDSDDEDDEDEDDEDGLSFSVPSRLSRCGSETDFAGSKSPEADTTARRFRSLSLMDPALQAPFAQDVSQQREAGRREPPTMENIEDEMCSPNANRLKCCTNIYVHDGQFGEKPISTAPRRARRIPRTKSANNVSVGLIPPEFFSRLSSPSSSNSSSNTSLSNLNILPGTFSKLLSASGETYSAEEEEPFSFKKGMVEKSSQSGKPDRSFAFAGNSLMPQDMNRFSLNFKSNKAIPVSAKALDDEDRMMFGSGSINEQTSDEESKSNTDSISTLIDNGVQNAAASESPSLKSFNLQIYADDESKAKPKSQSNSIKPSGPAKPTYKKPKFTLDLYGDDEMQSNGGWLLGGNAK
ncbi:LANO_0G08130g1_1 [Lachancea nothofagi CBS 11611]|uniref:LANO_0G08130g1_1 n=1 Tax=Lachancea nothofagi CBS 11611 TaxID=1266666 RepID=A0A1G4KI58_9SACH|nr:LANO_0G08130g1_1 [Lachancea nothofagi CBS 11611]